MRSTTARFSLLVYLTISALALTQAQKRAEPAKAAPAKAAPGVIILAVDASQAPQKLLHAKLTIPATPGPLTLLYPKWIPGEHGPTGPITDFSGLKFMAAGRTISWRRDDVDMYTFHLDVPAGANAVEASLDFVSPVAGQAGFSGGASATAKMMVVSWNQLLLYPSGFSAEQLTYKASLRLPAGWSFGTPLPLARAGQTENIEFAPATLYTLVDSPVIAGEFYRRITLTPSAVQPQVVMDIAADSAAALAMSPEVETFHKNLVKEAVALFGAQHYRDYHFLFSLSDRVAHFGLEHHEANDSRAAERSLINDNLRKLMAGLLPHEYVHSWNGKYRRPAGLSTPDYQQPMKGELLWVYEGLTTYLGNVLTARSGLWNAEQYRDVLALTAAAMAHRVGRKWRSLQDTAVAAQILYLSPIQWSSWRRSVDFYPESDLIWLEADTIIRQQTQGQKSLDDFCRLFHGGANNPADVAPTVKPYTFEDVVTAMNQVAAYDWRKFFLDRLQYTGPNAPLGGIEASGWRLVYTDQPSEMFRIAEQDSKQTDAQYSIGLLIAQNGQILDSIVGMAAEKAGIGPGMKLVAVNGREFSNEVLQDALKAGRNSSEALQLLVENGGYYKTYTVNYHDGPRYPQLVRDSSKSDVLGDIIRPHAK